MGRDRERQGGRERQRWDVGERGKEKGTGGDPEAGRGRDGERPSEGRRRERGGRGQRDGVAGTGLWTEVRWAPGRGARGWGRLQGRARPGSQLAAPSPAAAARPSYRVTKLPQDSGAAHWRGRSQSESGAAVLGQEACRRAHLPPTPREAR